MTTKPTTDTDLKDAKPEPAKGYSVALKFEGDPAPILDEKGTSTGQLSARVGGWGGIATASHQHDSGFYSSTIRDRALDMTRRIVATCDPNRQAEAGGLAEGYGDVFSPDSVLHVAVWVEHPKS